MRRSERLANYAFRRLAWAIVTVGATGTALIWSVALTLSKHVHVGALLGMVTIALGMGTWHLLAEAARLWKLVTEEEAHERLASIRPKLTFHSMNTARGTGRN